MTLLRSLAAVVVLAFFANFSHAGGAEDPADGADSVVEVSYYRQIRPIFQAHCQGCHQPAKAMGEYQMTSFAKLLSGGESGSAAITPGNPAESFLIQQITPVDGRAEMPKKGDPLHEVEIELISRWIAQGAVDDTPEDATVRYSNEHPPTYSQPPVITAVRFSPDGQLLAISGFHEVLLHRADGSGLVARLIGLSERIQSIRFSPDGSKLAVTGGLPGRMGELQIWDVASHELTLSLPVTFDTIYGASWSPDQKLVAFGCADNAVRAVNAETGEQVLYQGSHNGWVFDTVFSVDGSHLVSVGRDMTAKLIEVPTQRFVDNITSITPKALKGGISSVTRHPRRDEILFGGADGIPKIYQMHRTTNRQIGDDANQLWELPPLPGRVFSVDYSNDASRIVAGSSLDGSGAVHIYGIDPDYQVPGDIKAILVKPTHTRSADELDKLQSYFRTGIQTFAQVAIPSSGIYAVALNPDGSRVAAGGSDGKVRLLDSTDGQLVKEFVPVEITPEAETARVALAGVILAEPKFKADEEPLPSPRNVVSLEAYPAQISLRGPHEYTQLVVTARLESGDTLDVTRVAQYQIAASLASVTANGLLTPRADGVAELVIAFDSQQVTVPVELHNIDTQPTPDYIRDVMPVMSRLGCNLGTCHGAKDGKNGFKLSLRGYDPIYDIRALADDMASRRINTASPDNSLMLLKSTANVPHEGGQVTTPDSKYYQILRGWIAGGAKLDQNSPRVRRIEVAPQNPVVQAIGGRQQMRVVATYSDGSSRDVTYEAFVESGNTDIVKPEAGRAALLDTFRRGEAPVLVRFEGAYAATTITVMGDRNGFAWQQPPSNNPIDGFVAEKLRRTKTAPSPICSDYDFIRRVYLDLTGLPPSPREIREFVDDRRDSRWKREELIDRLIGSPAYVEHWANKWADLLQVNSKFLGSEGAAAFRAWIQQEVAQNTPYDELCRKILTASGSNKDNPAASYYKILRTPAETMENTTHLFLATRFNCNKCHDHPFERWTQDQYYQLSSYFAQVGLKKDPASGDRQIGGTAVESGKPLYEVVFDQTEGEVTHERTGEVAAPAFPYETKFQTGDQATRREKLAAWITSPDNRYFARSYVNRLWGYLNGVGIIEPIDDIRAGNPPTNPDLLEWLTKEFVSSGFDIQHMVRLICKSRTYQLSIEPNQWNADDHLNYSHALPRRLPAEVLYDTIYAVTGAKSNFPGVPAGTRAAALPDAGIKLPDGFLGNLGRPVRESACECERSNDLQLGPVMALVSGPTVGDALADPHNRIADLVQQYGDDRQLVNELFLSILNRPAQNTEIDVALDLMNSLDQEHASMASRLADAERSWKPQEEELARQRNLRIAAANEELAAYRQKMQPTWEGQRAAREAAIATARLALAGYDGNLAEHTANWERSGELATRWQPLNFDHLSASQGATLAREAADGSIFVSGQEGKGNYDLATDVFAPAITGIRIEALRDDRLPRGGPGRADDGNFVLTEVKLRAAELAATKETALQEWTFADAAGWQAAGDCNLEARDGVLQVTSTGADPQLIRAVEATGATFVLEVQARVDGQANSQLFWATKETEGYAEDRSVSLTLSGGGQWLVYRYYFNSGRDLTGLRFDPDDKGGTLQLRSLKLSRIEPPEFKDVALTDAQADYSQDKYDVATAVDGKEPENDNGWAIAPQMGQNHVAVFALKEPLQTSLGSRLELSLKQNFQGGKHALGRFRVAVTSSPQPLDFGLPGDIKEVLAIAAEQRTPEQTARLQDYFRQNSRDRQRLQAELASAEAPLPEDPGLKQRESQLVEAERPIEVDPQLVRLRQEVATSQNQLANKRLTAAQDIAWALINNPAFLFNH